LSLPLLAGWGDAWVFGYEAGLVPVALPWLAVGLGAATLVALRTPAGRTPLGIILMIALVVTTAWSVVNLPFDVLRILRLVPLPWSLPGLGYRLSLTVGAAAVVGAVLADRLARRPTCASCRRPLAARPVAIPRWPVVVGVLVALVYPLLKLYWTLGGTAGTVDGPVDLGAVAGWATVVGGLVLAALAGIMALEPQGLRVRTALSLVGLPVGLGLATMGLLGSAPAWRAGFSQGWAAPVDPDDPFQNWAFALVYESWLLAGLAIMLGGLRLWSLRWPSCPTCSA
jgi:hypothetical protein